MIQTFAARAEHIGHGVQQGADLGVAVARPLDRLGVEAEGDVVDEHAAVDLAEVHPPLAPVDERLESADHIVAINPEVQREMVAGAGGYARVRQPELGGDRGHDRLRAVPTRHRQPVRAALDRPTDQRLEIIAGLQLDRLDPARARLLVQRETLRLSPAGSRIEEQHRSGAGPALGRSTWTVKRG